jgi:hypothetical protein
VSATDAVSGGTRYRFEQRLASGGMADLFVAQAMAAGGVRKRVAVKRVQPRHASDDEFVAMFLNEARLASTLQHPNIVQTYDVLQVRGEYFIVMELLEGVDLQEFMRLQAKMPDLPLRIGHVLYIIERALGAAQPVIELRHQCHRLGGRAPGGERAPAAPVRNAGGRVGGGEGSHLGGVEGTGAGLGVAGASTTYVTRVEGRPVTVMGEVPLRTARFIAAQVRRVAPAAPAASAAAPAAAERGAAARTST